MTLDDIMKKILVVYKRSSFDLYCDSKDDEMCAYMHGSSENVRRMKESHERQERAIARVREVIASSGTDHEMIYRAELATFDHFRDYSMAIALGGDGTFLEVSRYLCDIPIMGVNTDPSNSVGYYTTSDAERFPDDFARIPDLPRTQLPRGRIVIDGNVQHEQFVNDVLIAHTSPAATTLLLLGADGAKKEFYKGHSGLIVSTAGGSTAWMYQAGGSIMPFDDNRFQYLLRDKRDFLPRFAERLEVESLTRSAQIYVDGDHVRHEFPMGSKLEITQGTPVEVIGDLSLKRAAYQ